MIENKETYSGTSKESNSKVIGQLSISKLIVLCVVSLVLCAVGPLAIFSPIPLAIAFLMYGFAKTFSISAIAIFLTMALSMTSPTLAPIATYSVMMIVVTIAAFMIASIVVRKEHPVKGFISRALFSVGIIFAIMLAFNAISSESLVTIFEREIVAYTETVKATEDYQTLVKTGGVEARQVEQFMTNPLEMLREFYSMFYSVLFVLTMFVFWLSTFTVMKNKALWQNLHDYKYGLQDFIRFKVPDLFIYIIVLGLGFYVGADYLGNKAFESIGGNIILCLGVLYFFQGMGVYLDFLRYLKVYGLLRNLLTIMTIFYGYQFVAIAGLFDTWVNFRKFFKKK